jgi:hypothetical protein
MSTSISPPFYLSVYVIISLCIYVCDLSVHVRPCHLSKVPTLYVPSIFTMLFGSFVYSRSHRHTQYVLCFPLSPLCALSLCLFMYYTYMYISGALGSLVYVEGHLVKETRSQPTVVQLFLGHVCFTLCFLCAQCLSLCRTLSSSAPNSYHLISLSLLHSLSLSLSPISLSLSLSLKRMNPRTHTQTVELSQYHTCTLSLYVSLSLSLSLSLSSSQALEISDFNMEISHTHSLHTHTNTLSLCSASCALGSPLFSIPIFPVQYQFTLPGEDCTHHRSGRTGGGREGDLSTEWYRSR